MRVPLAVLLSILTVLVSGVSFAGEEETKPSLKIIVTDEKGNAVPDCKAMLAVGETRHTSWYEMENQSIAIPHYDLKDRHLSRDGEVKYLNHATLFVRAPGFVTAFRPVEIGPGSQTEKVELRRGQTVTVTIRTADERPLPDDLSPLIMLEGYRKPAAFSWSRDPELRKEFRPLANWLGLERTDVGTYQFQASKGLPPVYLHIDHRGFLRCYESEALEWDNLKDGKVAIKLPKPASIAAKLDFSEEIEPAELPIQSYHVRVGRSLDPDASTFFTVKSKSYQNSDFEFHLDNLAPGQVKIYLSTESDEPTTGPSGRAANPGTFRAREAIKLAAGQDKIVAIPFRAFDPEPFEGDHNITLRIVDTTGAPVDDRKFRLTYSDMNYGRFQAASGTITDGMITLKGLKATDGMEYPTRYSLAVGEHLNRVGAFAVNSDSESQTVEFQLIPNVGDKVPDFVGVDAITGKPFELSRHDGKVILIEFWTTWCGPCQSPMAKLNIVAEEQADEWQDRVALIAVSLDEERETAKKHLENRDWVHCRNVWGGDKQSSARENIVANRTGGDFSVTAFPTMLLIDREGVIRYRGHPGSLDIVPLIQKLLGEK